MSCLDNLINCMFLKNTSSEIVQARRVLQVNDEVSSKSIYLPLRTKDRKKLYDHYLDLWNFKQDLEHINLEDLDAIYTVQENNIVWMASRLGGVIDIAITEALYITGDLYIYRGRHFIQNKLIHTVLYDLNFQVPPPTTN